MRKFIFWLCIIWLAWTLFIKIPDIWPYIVISYEYVNHLDIP